MIIIENITLVIERHLKRSRKRREPIRIPRHSLAIMSQCRVLNLSSRSHKQCVCLSVCLSVSPISCRILSFFHIPQVVFFYLVTAVFAVVDPSYPDSRKQGNSCWSHTRVRACHMVGLHARTRASFVIVLFTSCTIFGSLFIFQGIGQPVESLI